ncbi:MAG: hypothetical protein L6R41_003991 [Letrouitia leprolyta]|nr:MAG: hypothetical protein L6R41_003991 [Letrouitia leprolyta]
MSATKETRTVLITGCSDGGLGAALAMCFHDAGLHVYATARNISKMKQLAAHGIETLELDVQSESSIAGCVSKVPKLDILVNNAGAQMTMAVTDISISEAKNIFDINVWSMVAVTQAFIPLLLKSKDVIVNHTSVASSLAVPFGGTYGASKAAASTFSDTMRLELGVFDVKVVELKTGLVGPTNLIRNNASIKEDRSRPLLPENSIYQPAKDVVEQVIRQEAFAASGMAPAEWAKGVVRDVLKSKSPPIVWRGESAFVARVGSILPVGILDGVVKKATKMDQVEKILKLARS